MDSPSLLCGDATVLADVEKVLAGGLADMVFTDPPYNINYEGRTEKKLKIRNDQLGSKFYEFLRDASANILAVTKGAVYICMSSSELHTIRQAFLDAGGHWSGIIIWVKNHFTLGWGDYRHQYEPIVYGWREGGTHYWCGDRNQGDTWQIKRPAANREHPTMKPVELVERALRNNSKSRDTILDPFGGSGTAIIACQKTGRQARVIELDPRYCDVSVRRWQAFTGGVARLDGSERAFDDVAGERGQAHPVIRTEEAPDVDSFEAQKVIEQLATCDVDDVVLEGDAFRVTLRVLGGTVTHLLKMPSAKDVNQYRRGFARVLDLPFNRQELTINMRAAGDLYKKLIDATEGYAGDAPIIHQAVAVKAAIDALDASFQEDRDVNF